MMENNQDNIFSGIPSLNDEAGFNDFVTQQGVQSATEGLPTPPAMLQGNEQGQVQPQVQPQTNPEQNALNPMGNQEEPTYTRAQVEALIAQQTKQYQDYIASLNGTRQNVPGVPGAQGAQGNRGYVNANNYQAIEAQKQAIISQLRANGVPEERIQNALNEGRQRNAMNQRIAMIEQQLQQQQYQKDEAAFIDKMTGFGNKFGLTEDDLVTFANKAYSQGINVAQVPAEFLENIFRAVYPQQYAVRVQRMSNMPNSQLYGGVSISEAPRAAASKAEDAYVEAFLKGTMPNQYNNNNR